MQSEERVEEELRSKELISQLERELEDVSICNSALDQEVARLKVGIISFRLGYQTQNHATHPTGSAPIVSPLPIFLYLCGLGKIRCL